MPHNHVKVKDHSSSVVRVDSDVAEEHQCSGEDVEARSNVASCFSRGSQNDAQTTASQAGPTARSLY